MKVVIRRGSDRFVERVSGRLSKHGFSFGEHYDPDWLGFGPLVCHDDHLLGSGIGFDAHSHEGVEIVSYVVEGELVHTDGAGEQVVVPAGSAAVWVPGEGALGTHSEHASANGPCRFVQVWLRSTGEAPGYRVVDPALGLSVGTAALQLVRLDGGETYTFPAAPMVHAFVATGALLRASLAEPLSAGDAYLLTDRSDVTVTAGVPTTLLVWTFPA